MDRSRIAPPDPRGVWAARDQVVVLHGLSWDQYVEIDDARRGASRPSFAYLDGDLEIVVTSMRHELVKKLIARLVEAFTDETGIPLIGAGNTTFRKKLKRAGAEPDECYFIGRVGKVPDLAIEIVHASGGIDKLEIYRRLGVREVWFWIDNRFWIYCLDGKFKESRRSVTLPRIDLDAVARIVAATDDDKQAAAVRAYRRSLRRRR